MTRIEKRVLIRNSLLGILLTLVVLMADWHGKEGMLSRLENNLYDLRARKFQYFTPPPTDRLVHIDIDDPSLQYIGQWPWKRSMLAQLTDEIRMAGAKAIGFDVLFAEAQETQYRPVEDAGEPVSTQAAGSDQLKGTFMRVDEDEAFAAALHRFTNSILPASFDPKPAASRLRTAIYDTLMEDLLQTPEEARETVIAKGLSPGSDLEFRTSFANARKEALYNRLMRLMDQSADISRTETITQEKAIEMLFKERDTLMKKRLPPGLFLQQYRKATAFRSLRRFARPIPPDLPPMLPVTPVLPPIPVLANSITGTSFVNHLSDPDGVVRSIELWRNSEGWLYPQLGLRLACAVMDVDLGAIDLQGDHIEIPRADGTALIVPVFSLYSVVAGRDCGMFIPLPWFGPSQREDDWTRMYDRLPTDNARQHVPMVKVWEILDVRDKIRGNNESLTQAIGTILKNAGRAELERFAALDLDIDDVATRIKWVNDIIAKKMDDFATDGTHLLPAAEFEALLATIEDVETRNNLRQLVAAAQNLRKLRELTLEMQDELIKRRAWLRNEMEGRAALVGFTATGRMDVVPTSLLPSCPGPVVHGVVFNAILTGDVWTRASPWVTRGFTLLIGLLATAIVAYFHPVNALLTSIAMTVGYVFFNSLFLFDYHNTIVGLAGPLVTVGLVWSGCTLMRFVVERAERRHIENRFRSYVDPALVNFVIENPEKIHLEGESRELTVVFTDLAGFTTISEKLKERVVPILNEYMGRMVSIIRDSKKPSNRQGYRNKFLGDGIMFFFGAPYHNATHAVDAVATVLNMQEAMGPFNEWLAAQNLPAVKMRAGISTGQMVVGDAGSPDASDYTVLGDDVNFGARLESANKATGTLVMVSQRTRTLCGSLFLFRPVARLQVVGKTMGLLVYEPICFHENATPEQIKYVSMTEAVIDTFTRAEFTACLERIGELDEAYGVSKLGQLYRRQCENFLAEPPGADFNGTIVLESK